MKRRYTAHHNTTLKPLPDDDAFVGAVKIVQRRNGGRHAYKGASAADVAFQLGIQPARRMGNGAVKGSWTGSMSPALRAVSRLRSLYQQGKLIRMWDGDYKRWAYYVPDWHKIKDWRA